MQQRSKSSLSHIKLPKGLKIEDVEKISFKVKNKWIHGDGVSVHCEVKYNKKTKPGLKLQSPLTILYRSQSQEKFKELYAKKEELTIPKQNLFYQVSDCYVADQERKTNKYQNLKIIPPSQPYYRPAIKSIPKQPIASQKLLGIFTFNPQQDAHKKKQPDPNGKNLSIGKNLQALIRITQDIEKMTQKVKVIRKIVELNGQTPLNKQELVAQKHKPINLTPKKSVRNQERSLYNAQTEKKQVSNDEAHIHQAEQTNRKNKDLYMKPVVYSSIYELIKSPQTQSQYIEGFVFDKLAAIATENPQNGLEGSRQIRKSQDRRPGLITKNNLSNGLGDSRSSQASTNRRTGQLSKLIFPNDEQVEFGKQTGYTGKDI